MKYLVAVSVRDMRSGAMMTVPFLADTQDRAKLLRDLLLTAMHAAGGAVQSFGVDNSALRLSDVTVPARCDFS